jgi:WD40 repeat protein
VTWSGHKRAITALRFNHNGGMLASGSQDTDIVMWDVVGETGLFRLRAHTAEVTDLVCACFFGGLACYRSSTMQLMITSNAGLPSHVAMASWPFIT